MKNIFFVLFLSFLFSGNVLANANNPTNEWLKDKTVNDLTQKYGYRLFSVDEFDTNTTLFTLTKGKIVVGCLSAPGNPKIKFYCYLP